VSPSGWREGSDGFRNARPPQISFMAWTKRIASASGVTTSVLNTASSDGCGTCSPTSVFAHTATATARVRRDIATQLGLRNHVELVGSFDRPNLVYRVLARADFKRQLTEILARHSRQAGIVYCTSRKEVDALAAWLVESGVRARGYHAGMSDSDRSRNQDAFLDEHADVVVATVAFGMGIDRSDVRFVVHAGAPQSLEHYQQESGRAGRDGLEAECVLVYSTADFLKWRVMLDGTASWTDARRTLLREERMPRASDVVIAISSATSAKH
jgi:ATP-dependent DNA helicase RecQ